MKRNPKTSAPLTALERIATALEAHLKLLQGGPILYGEIETATKQASPDCEPTQEALDEIARLLNDNEHSEALKELRRMHGLVDRFVCTNCGDISSCTGPGFLCLECGGYLTTRVVVAQPAPEPPTLEDVLAAYRRAVEMAGIYSGRICDACAHPHTVVCGHCLVGWKLQFQPKEAAQ